MCGQTVVEEHGRRLMTECLELFVEIGQIYLPVDAQPEKQAVPADLLHQWPGSEMSAAPR
ncbi:hypothetical protein D3C80_2236590 [compost metagenome]